MVARKALRDGWEVPSAKAAKQPFALGGLGVLGFGFKVFRV